MEIYRQVFCLVNFYFTCFLPFQSRYRRTVFGGKKKKSFCSLISPTDHQNEQGNSCHTKLDIHPFHRKNRGSEHVNLHVKARGTELSPTGPSTFCASDKRSLWHTYSSQHLARFKEKLLRDIAIMFHWNKSYKIRQNSCRQPRWGKHKYLKWFTKFSLLYHIAP